MKQQVWKVFQIKKLAWKCKDFGRKKKYTWHIFSWIVLVESFKTLIKISHQIKQHYYINSFNVHIKLIQAGSNKPLIPIAYSISIYLEFSIFISQLLLTNKEAQAMYRQVLKQIWHGRIQKHVRI